MSDGNPRPARRQSIRTQLVLWNVLALALLLGVLGVIVRYAAYGAILASVDAELDQRTRPPAGHPPGEGPHGEGPHGEGPHGEGPHGEGPHGEGPHGEGPHGGFDHGPPPDLPPGSREPFRPPFRGGPPDGSPPLSLPPRRPNFGDAPEGDTSHPRFYDLQGRPLRAKGVMPLDPGGFARAARGETVYSTVTTMQGSFRVLTHPIPNFGPPQGVVQAAYPLSDVNRALGGVDRALLTLIPLGLLGAGLGGALLTGRVLARVRAMAQAAGRISDADLGVRLPVLGRDEFADLAGAFNAVLDRLEAAFGRQARLMDQQRRFTADASHELKTPLTIIKGNTSMALSAGTPILDRQALAEMDAAADGMGRLVQDLLLLARFDSAQSPRPRIELLIGEVLTRAAGRTAGRAGVPIQVNGSDEALTVWGDEEELERLFANLLDNAVRHTPDGGTVRVVAERQGECVRVTIVDTGCGIASEHLPHLGERFYRVDSARSRSDGGTGLGLSICRSIVEAHGGTMTFESVLGQGTTVRVTLPAVPPRL